MSFRRLPLHDIIEQQEEDSQEISIHKLKKIKEEERENYLEGKLKEHKKKTKTEKNDPIVIFQERIQQLPKSHKEATIHLIQSLNKSRLLNKEFIEPIIQLAKFSKRWIRKPEEWTPSTYNPTRQFKQLAHHLFAEYPVPKWMYNCWFIPTDVSKGKGQPSVQTQKLWFIDIGQGVSFRKLEKSPIKITKRMAHLLREAPEKYDGFEALRWAQIIAANGPQHLVDAALYTRLGNTFRHDDFWFSVINFFINNPMLDVAYLGPIIDYVTEQKYRGRREWLDDGIYEDRGPPQPNFSMKGRTPEVLLRQVDEWHGDLAKMQGRKYAKWEPDEAIEPMELIEGSIEKKNLKIWKIEELIDSVQLQQEGRKLRHCVASFVDSCLKGRCSIWSLSVEGMSGVEKCITIEVRGESIVQARGKVNRLPTPKELQVIDKWAKKNDLAQKFFRG